MATLSSNFPDLDTIDFKKLADKDLEFGALWLRTKKSGGIDWKDASHQQALTRALLRCHFNLRVELTSDRLIPPVPVRYKYIRWIQRLLDATGGDFSLEHDPKRQVAGLDVGVGASCIYPLLGSATYPSWRFYGTDIDTQSLSLANSNVFKNDLSARIHLFLMTPESPLFPLDTIGVRTLDFTMCNPPFYESQEEIDTKKAAKAGDARAIYTGVETETITPGGEAAFACRMVDESIQLKERVQWYTTKLSKKESIEAVVGKLRNAGCRNWALSELRPGEVTVRWVLGWSWRDLRPPPDVSRHVSGIPSKLLPFHPEPGQPLAGRDPGLVFAAISDQLASLDLEWRHDADNRRGIALSSLGDVWSRAYRRAKQRGQLPAEDAERELGVRVVVTKDSLEMLWIKGVDEKVFERFYTMVTRIMHGVKVS